LLPASAAVAYSPGKIFRAKNGKAEVFVPQLRDFGAPVFLRNHCFVFAGDTSVGGATFARLEFAPSAEVNGNDVMGVVSLRRDGYSIASVVMTTTGVPEAMTDEIQAVRLGIEYQELVPGISVITRVESDLAPGRKAIRKNPNLASTSEIQTLIGIAWRNGPP